MNISFRKRHRIIALAIVGLASVGLVAWNHEPTYRDADSVYYRDTVPDKIGNREPIKDYEKSQDRNGGGTRDLDRELQKLDDAERTIDKLSQKNWKELSDNIEKEIGKIDLEKIGAEVDAALAKVDMKKINDDVMAALKEVDFDKISQSVSESLAEAKDKIDSEEVRRAVAEAKEEIRKAKLEIKKELNAEMEEVKKINKEEIRKAIGDAKAELKKVKEDLKNGKMEFKTELEDAKLDIRKAREEIKGYQKMIYDMEEDKLLNTTEDYSIEYKDGTLLINGKTQPDAVTSKYKKHFNKNHITIRKHKGEMDIVN
jgi:hypothetical protein